MAKIKAKNVKQGQIFYAAKGHPNTVRGVVVSNKKVTVTAETGKGVRTIDFRPDQLIEVQ